MWWPLTAVSATRSVSYTHLDGIVDLFPYIVHADAPRLAVGHIDEIRVVSPKDLFAGMAYHTRLIASFFTKERHGKWHTKAGAWYHRHILPHRAIV